MGAKESKQSCISYDDAVKRVSDTELRRIKDAFKKSAGVGRSYLSQKAFHQDVLCEGVPSDIAQLLFTACGGSAKGISFRDLLCGLVLLSRGTEEEKIRFLWSLYCNDTGTHISKTDFTNAACMSPHEDVALFSQSNRVSFDQFRDWIRENSRSMILAKWLLVDACITLTSELETPTFYQSLAGVTHLEEKDIGDLEKQFWRLKNSSPTGQIDFQLLGPLVSPPIPKNALIGLFNAFDENRDGHIDFKELCCGVSAACRGPIVERTLCFKIFDIDRDGVLSHDETRQLLNILLFVAKESKHSVAYNNLRKEEVIIDLRKFSTLKYSQKGIESEQNFTSENICLTPEDFMMWTVESNMKLVQPFLDLVFEVCHIVFGLWPQCRHLEYDIVKGWLLREEKRQYRVGEFWYLISKDWWITWVQYTQSNTTSCEICKKSYIPKVCHVVGVDEAMVCDESFNSSSLEYTADTLHTADSYSLGSASSGFSSSRDSSLRPGPIDNSSLVTTTPYKNVKTLTGEGGHLKRYTPLVQSRDFELVPKSLWKALNRWYGDNLPLPRQVVQPPDSTDVELELYPLNLRILLHHNISNNLPVTNSGGYGTINSGGAYAAVSATNMLRPPRRYLAYTAAFSRLATMRQIAEFLCEQLRLKLEDTRLWHISAGSLDNAAILLEEEHLTLKELSIKDDDQLLVEIRNKDLTWPEELGSLVSSQNATASDRRLTRSSVQSVHVPGATGLHNLGNTCFMNAALQVLFNTQPLAKYFHRNMHIFELNTGNKLGTRGQIATRYGELLKEVWTANTRSVAPLKLRFCVNKHAPQFGGGGQHDSQELLEWLLDALHEDLNRVAEKHYSELKDSNGRPDTEVAAEAWAQHNARNQSIIIDLFYGQLKSKVRCLCCGTESVRFDPFSLLSLPLPVENFVYFEVLVILLDGSIPTKYGLRLNSESKYLSLKHSLSSLCGLSPKLMLICEVSNSQIREVLCDDQKIKTSSAKELYVYQLPEECGDQSHASSIKGLNIENGLEDIQRNSASCSAISPIDLMTNASHDSADKESIQPPSVRGSVQDDNVVVDNYDRVTTKQAAEMSTSPENTFANGFGKGVSTPKSFHTVNKNCSNFLYISDENSAEGERVILHQTKSASGEGERDFNTLSCNFPQDQKAYDKYTKDTTEKVQFYDHDPESGYSENSGTAKPNNLTSVRTMPECCRAGKYLVAVHRKITRQDTYYLSCHKTRPSLFGVPLLIPSCKEGTQKDLYCAIWLQVSRLLSPLPATKDQSNHAADCDDSLGYNYPFTLRAVKSDGLNCAFCPWSNFCRGCEVQCNDDFLFSDFELHEQHNSTVQSQPSGSYMDIVIAIDWDPTALHLRYQSTLERLWIEHTTVELCRRKQTEPIDLDHCLQAFTSEEELEQWYHCSNCRGNKPATKKLQIWKLPPILIFHLKRFNYVNGKWVKSQKVVHFPFDDFDPTPYLASVPQATILRHRELVMQNSFKMSGKCKQQLKSIAQLNEKPQVAHEAHATDGKLDAEEPRIDKLLSISETINPSNALSSLSSGDCESSTICATTCDEENDKVKTRRRLDSPSLTKTPAVDLSFQDFHQHKLKNPNDYLNPKYKLYAVVSHSGMLNGGHYISYAANSSKTWYCYNDSSCREIPNQPNIDPSSAYLLFYERRGLDYEPYMPNIEGKTSFEEMSFATDDADNDLRKLCLIS